MSGLHTSINTHVSANFYKLNSEEPYKNTTYFLERIGDHPDRVKNLHFIYSAAVRAVGLIHKAMRRQDYNTGINQFEDKKTIKLVDQLLSAIDSHSSTFNEHGLFKSMTGHKTRVNTINAIDVETEG
jgi:hypothetical protein